MGNHGRSDSGSVGTDTILSGLLDTMDLVERERSFFSRASRRSRRSKSKDAVDSRSSTPERVFTLDGSNRSGGFKLNLRRDSDKPEEKDGDKAPTRARSRSVDLISARQSLADRSEARKSTSSSSSRRAARRHRENKVAPHCDAKAAPVPTAKTAPAPTTPTSSAHPISSRPRSAWQEQKGQHCETVTPVSHEAAALRLRNIIEASRWSTEGKIGKVISSKDAASVVSEITTEQFSQPLVNASPRRRLSQLGTVREGTSLPLAPGGAPAVGLDKVGTKVFKGDELSVVSELTMDRSASGPLPELMQKALPVERGSPTSPRGLWATEEELEARKEICPPVPPLMHQASDVAIVASDDASTARRNTWATEEKDPKRYSRANPPPPPRRRNKFQNTSTATKKSKAQNTSTAKRRPPPPPPPPRRISDNASGKAPLPSSSGGRRSSSRGRDGRTPASGQGSGSRRSSSRGREEPALRLATMEPTTEPKGAKQTPTLVKTKLVKPKPRYPSAPPRSSTRSRDEPLDASNKTLGASNRSSSRRKKRSSARRTKEESKAHASSSPSLLSRNDGNSDPSPKSPEGRAKFDQYRCCLVHPSTIVARKSPGGKGWSMLSDGCPKCLEAGSVTSSPAKSRKTMNSLSTAAAAMLETGRAAYRPVSNHKPSSGTMIEGARDNVDDNVVARVSKMPYTTPWGKSGWYSGEVIDGIPNGTGRMQFEKGGGQCYGEWRRGYPEQFFERNGDNGRELSKTRSF